MPLERIPWSPTRRLAEMAAGRAVGRTVWTTVWRPGWFVTYQPVSLQPSERAAQTVLNTIEMAVRVAGWRAEPLPRTAERVLDAVLPLVDGLEAGLWLFWVSLSAVMAVARPALRTEDRLLHCPDGPAVWWPDGPEYFFWRGVEVPEKVIVSPLDLTAAEITDEWNAEVRRVMLERYSAARYLQDIGAQLVDADETGELYRAEMGEDEPLCMVRVVDKSALPDGSFRAYWLRVPPNMQTAREAVAWTFEVAPDEYRPLKET